MSMILFRSEFFNVVFHSVGAEGSDKSASVYLVTRIVQCKKKLAFFVSCHLVGGGEKKKEAIRYKKWKTGV